MTFKRNLLRYKQTCMNSLIRVLFCVGIVQMAISTTDPVIVSRAEWGAEPPKSIEVMDNPVPYVVVHHSYQPSACYNKQDCIAAMHWMQKFHQINNSWVDIGYHFAVGSDGLVYEGRGWSRVGAHSPGYNDISIGICLIGDWREKLPPEEQLVAVHNLVGMGVREGKIMIDYKLVGHRQVRPGTVCPGERLYEEIEQWPHYCEHPDKPGRNSSVATSPENTNKLRKRTVLS